MRMIAVITGICGAISMLMAVIHERRMQRARRPGVTYARVTWRRDGGWKRSDLFTDAGLAHQRRASRYGAIGAALWILALLLAIVSVARGGNP
jgi:hypothetical protein